MALIDIMPRLKTKGLVPYTIPLGIPTTRVVVKIRGKIIGIISISAIFFQKFFLYEDFHINFLKNGTYRYFVAPF